MDKLVQSIVFDGHENRRRYAEAMHNFHLWQQQQINTAIGMSPMMPQMVRTTLEGKVEITPIPLEDFYIGWDMAEEKKAAMPAIHEYEIDKPDCWL